jgi:hypothetical protein
MWRVNQGASQTIARARFHSIAKCHAQIPNTFMADGGVCSSDCRNENGYHTADPDPNLVKKIVRIRNTAFWQIVEL